MKVGGLLESKEAFCLTSPSCKCIYVKSVQGVATSRCNNALYSSIHKEDSCGFLK